MNLGPSFQLGPVDIRIQKGNHTALLGPSGSGKSTLLKLLTGYLVPDGGTVVYKKKALNLSEQLLLGFDDIAYLAQDFSVPPYQKIEEVFRQRLAKYPISVQISQLNQLAKQFQIEPFLAQKRDELSLGQLQRCALALAFAGEPSLVALDEPFSHQDALLRQTMLKAVWHQTKQTRCTLLLCTHSLEEAYFLTNEALYLSSGKKIFHGPINDLKKVSQPEVKALFGWVDIQNNKAAIWKRSITQKTTSIAFVVTDCKQAPKGYWLLGVWPDGAAGLIFSQKPASASEVVWAQAWLSK